MSQHLFVGESDGCYLSKCSAEEVVSYLRNNKKSWVDDAVADVISYLYYNNLLTRVVQAVIKGDPFLKERKPIDDVALELEALAVVVASVRALLYGITEETGGIDVSGGSGYLLDHYVRHEYREEDGHRDERVTFYDVRFRFAGKLYRPELEFLYVNSGSADLLLRVTPADWPPIPIHALRSARWTIWKIAKRPIKW